MCLELNCGSVELKLLNWVSGIKHVKFIQALTLGRKITTNITHKLFFKLYFQEEASKKCFEEVVDNLCIVFDLNHFTLSCMDYQVLKNMIWLLSRHYPERLGVCLIINAPTFFSGCWAVIKGW